MGVLVFVLGKSGTGKSYSMRNFQENELAIINVQGKVLPFRNGSRFPVKNTDNSSEIIRNMGLISHNIKSIVIDDFQYLMANEFMRRSSERGYDKFTDIARHAWDIANAVRDLPEDVIVYIMCHTDSDDSGTEKIKTIGKMLDEKICLEGMSTIVLRTNVTDGVYSFLTQNNGKDTVKSPAGMFPTYAIDNDLYYVDQKIRNYYELGKFVSDAEIEKMDEVVKNEEIVPKKRGRKRGTQEEKPENTSAEKAEETTEAESGEPVEAEHTEELPKRKRRTQVEESLPDVTEAPPAAEDVAPEEKKSRRRRRSPDQEMSDLPFDTDAFDRKE